MDKNSSWAVRFIQRLIIFIFENYFLVRSLRMSGIPRVGLNNYLVEVTVRPVSPKYGGLEQCVLFGLLDAFSLAIERTFIYILQIISR